MVTFFLAANNYLLLCPKDEAVSFLLLVAREDTVSVSFIQRWLRRFSLCLVPEKKWRQKMEMMATNYPGGFKALQSDASNYKRTAKVMRRLLGTILTP